MSQSSANGTLDGPVGKIEFKIDYPKTASDAVVIISHPHPLYGGSMDNKVVYTIARACNMSGLIALRFNFRGVGKSQGKHAAGVGEKQDLGAIIKYAEDKFAGMNVALAGFSFGAAISLAVANDAPYKFLLTVAPPIYDEIKPITNIICPWGFFMGEADEVLAVSEVKNWLKQQQNSPQQYWFNNTGHFFHGGLIDLRTRIIEFIKSL